MTAAQQIEAMKRGLSSRPTHYASMLFCAARAILAGRKPSADYMPATIDLVACGHTGNGPFGYFTDPVDGQHYRLSIEPVADAIFARAIECEAEIDRCIAEAGASGGLARTCD